jgi:hypothetical protein
MNDLDQAWGFILVIFAGLFFTAFIYFVVTS